MYLGISHKQTAARNKVTYVMPLCISHKYLSIIQRFHSSRYVDIAFTWLSWLKHPA